MLIAAEVYLAIKLVLQHMRIQIQWGDSRFECWIGDAISGTQYHHAACSGGDSSCVRLNFERLHHTTDITTDTDILLLLLLLLLLLILLSLASRVRLSDSTHTV